MIRANTRQRNNIRMLINLFVTAICILFLIKVAQVLYNGSISSGTDLDAYFDGVRRFQLGLKLYRQNIDLPNEPQQFIYPPTLIFILLPFTTYTAAWWGWAIISLISWILALSLILWELRVPLQERLPPLWRPILVAALVNFPPTLTHLIWGQIQLPILFLLVLCWLLMRRGYNAIAGILLGISIALKIYPVFLILPLIIKKQWHTAYAAIISSIIFFVVSFVLVGWDQAYLYVTTVLPHVNNTYGNRADNASLTVFLQVIVGESPAVPWLSLILRISLILLAVVAVLKEPSPAHGFVISIVIMVVITPVVWTHYFVLLYLPWLTALAKSTGRTLWALGVSYVCIASASLVYYIPDQLVPIAQLLPMTGSLILLSILVRLIQTETASPQLPGTPPRAAA